MKQISRFLPFLRWFPMRNITFRADLVAGITTTLVMVPQAMAYAQLVGVPAYYGLYAAFLPGIIAALWGSSAQLSTGPAAVVSLLTASALAPLAASGSNQFITLMVMLALVVGLIQLALGLFKLGEIVNFLSHPVIAGFTNAAAIIIALSQFNKIFGVSMDRSDFFGVDIWGVFQQLGNTHIPTLVMGVSAFGIMWGLKKYQPKLPGVLIAVVLTTLVSWFFGYEHNTTGKIPQIMDAEVKILATELSRMDSKIAELNTKFNLKTEELKEYHLAKNVNSQVEAVLNYEISLLKLKRKETENENRKLIQAMRNYSFELVPSNNNQEAKLYLAGQVPEGEIADGYRWRITKVKKGEFKLIGGGEVIGSVPAGLPSFEMPLLDLNLMASLFSSALVIALVGFMEAISISKIFAAKTKERLDPNQELVGQGLANIVGSFSHSFPASGSFSRSAVNMNAGAKTGMAAVFTGVFVMITLIFLTPLLYHLPQAVLAAVIMMAVMGLINFQAIKHAWQTHKHDGIASVVTFIATLIFAPRLDIGIIVGGGLAILLYLYRTMKPRVVILGRHQDGTLRDAVIHALPACDYIVALRYDGSLYFANVGYFEEAVLEAVARGTNVKGLLIVSEGMNELDASGDEVIHHVVERLRSIGIRVVFSDLKKQVLEVMARSGLYDYIGQENIFTDEDRALKSLYDDALEVNPDTERRLIKQQASGVDGEVVWE
jgi:sulfate permease, SulP family